MIKSILKLAKKAEINALEKVAGSLSTLPEIERVLFFGSRARGDFDGSSDLDLLIVVTDIRVKNRVIGILHDIELEYDVPISPVVFTSKEYKINKSLKSTFIENLERDGIALYDSNSKG